jgi:hypothetical protein
VAQAEASRQALSRRSQDSGQLRADGAARAEQPYADRAHQETPERWLERIVELRKAGKTQEADKELAEFRKRYPDHKLPENLVRP